MNEKKHFNKKKEKKRKSMYFTNLPQQYNLFAKNINEDFVSDYRNLPKDSIVEKILTFNDKYNKLKC